MIISSSKEVRPIMLIFKQEALSVPVVITYELNPQTLKSRNLILQNIALPLEIIHNCLSEYLHMKHNSIMNYAE